MFLPLLLQPDGSPKRYFKLNSKKKKFWKIPLIILCFLVPILVWLAFGERGLIHLYRTEMERQVYIDRIRQLAEENQALLEEIHRLRTDMKYVESVARKELNLIKQNEIVYRFDKEKNRNNRIKTRPSKDRHGYENGRSEREVRHDGGVE